MGRSTALALEGTTTHGDSGGGLELAPADSHRAIREILTLERGR